MAKLDGHKCSHRMLHAGMTSRQYVEVRRPHIARLHLQDSASLSGCWTSSTWSQTLRTSKVPPGCLGAWELGGWEQQLPLQSLVFGCATVDVGAAPALFAGRCALGRPRTPTPQVIAGWGRWAAGRVRLRPKRESRDISSLAFNAFSRIWICSSDSDWDLPNRIIASTAYRLPGRSFLPTPQGDRRARAQRAAAAERAVRTTRATRDAWRRHPVLL